MTLHRIEDRKTAIERCIYHYAMQDVRSSSDAKFCSDKSDVTSFPFMRSSGIPAFDLRFATIQSKENSSL